MILIYLYRWGSAQLIFRKLLKHIQEVNFEPVIINIKGPYQNNSYDCGVYMLSAIEIIATNIYITTKILPRSLPIYALWKSGKLIMFI